MQTSFCENCNVYCDKTKKIIENNVERLINKYLDTQKAEFKAVLEGLLMERKSVKDLFPSIDVTRSDEALSFAVQGKEYYNQAVDIFNQKNNQAIENL